MPAKNNYLLHFLLFVVSFITTTLAGADSTTGTFLFSYGVIEEEHLMTFSDFLRGLPFSISFMTFLTVHEFGHYFTAIYHNVRSSLPYFIPMYIPMPGMLNIGSMGAVIRIRDTPSTTRKFFDIGIAGPLAGFCVSIIVLLIGFYQLENPLNYLYDLHPDYLDKFGRIPSTQEIFETYPLASEIYLVGTNLLLEGFKVIFPSKALIFPPAHEIVHFPFLFVGFLTLFFTALNLLPIGQLDGGHITYGLFGRKKAGIISRITVVFLIYFGGTGLMAMPNIDLMIMQAMVTGPYLLLSFILYYIFLVYVFRKILKTDSIKAGFLIPLFVMVSQAVLMHFFPDNEPAYIWLVYTFMATNFIGLDHPPAIHEHPLNTGRKILGWIAIIIFIICFSLQPLSLVVR